MLKTTHASSTAVLGRNRREKPEGWILAIVLVAVVALGITPIFDSSFMRGGPSLLTILRLGSPLHGGVNKESPCVGEGSEPPSLSGFCHRAAAPMVGSVAVQNTSGVRLDSIAPNFDRVIGEKLAQRHLPPGTPSSSASVDWTVIATIPVGGYPFGMAYDSGKGEVFVAASPGGNVTVINDTSNTVVSTIPVGFAVNHLAYDSGKGEMFATTLGTVAVISDSSDSVIASVSDGSGPWEAAYDPGRAEVFVTNGGSDSVTVIADATNTVVTTIPEGGSYSSPWGVAYDAKRSEVFVANFGAFNASVIDDGTDQVVATVALPINAVYDEDALYDPAKGEVFVASLGGGYLFGINDRTDAVNAAFPACAQPCGPSALAYDPHAGELFATNYDSNTVSVINDTNHTIVESVQVGSTPDGVAYDSGNGDLYVANSYDGNVSVLAPEYRVSFAETGLPVGTPWSVTLGGVTHDATTSDINFTELNGRYLYTIGNVPGWHQTTLAYSGIVVVNGAAGTEPTLDFNEVTYVTTFTETGLPSGKAWYVNITGGQSYGSTGSTINFSEPNGTQDYSVATTDKEYAPSDTGGSFQVSAAPTHNSVTFNLVNFSVMFAETGLPNGTEWWVNVSGEPSQGSMAGSQLFEEPNGTYNYTVGTLVGYRAAVPAASFAVSGRPLIVNVTFSASVGQTPPSNFLRLPGEAGYYLLVGAALIVAAGAAVAIYRRARRGRHGKEPPLR